MDRFKRRVADWMNQWEGMVPDNGMLGVSSLRNRTENMRGRYGWFWDLETIRKGKGRHGKIGRLGRKMVS